MTIEERLQPVLDEFDYHLEKYLFVRKPEITDYSNFFYLKDEIDGLIKWRLSKFDIELELKERCILHLNSTNDEKLYFYYSANHVQYELPGDNPKIRETLELNKESLMSENVKELRLSMTAYDRLQITIKNQVLENIIKDIEFTYQYVLSLKHVKNLIRINTGSLYEKNNNIIASVETVYDSIDAFYMRVI